MLSQPPVCIHNSMVHAEPFTIYYILLKFYIKDNSLGSYFVYYMFAFFSFLNPDYFLHNVQSRKYPYSPHGRFSVLHSPLTLPPGNYSLFSYIPSKNLAFKTPPPPPLGISSDLPWSGDGFFLELHNIPLTLNL